MTNDIIAHISDVEHVLDCGDEFHPFLSGVFELSVGEGIVVSNGCSKHLKTHCKVLQHKQYKVTRIFGCCASSTESSDDNKKYIANRRVENCPTEQGNRKESFNFRKQYIELNFKTCLKKTF